MATFTVTNLFDSGTGSFRQAIFDANATTGADDILFNEGLSGGTINLTSGELLIADDLTIKGLGADVLTVDAGGLSRVFNIDDGVDDSFIDVLIDGLTITGGKAPSSGSSFSSVQNSGGGILSRENLAINSSIISKNNGGGGIFSQDSDLTVTNSMISGNLGDGITINSPSSLDQIAHVRVANTTISGNSANGIFNYNSNLEVTQSTISGNSTSGIVNFADSFLPGNSYINGKTILTDSYVSDNLGRGIVNEGNMEVSNSTISNNSGGGIDQESIATNRFGFVLGRLTVKNSIITGNKTNSNGGGIYKGSGELYITNSTISNNQAVGNGGGIHIRPTFLYNTVDVTNSTISGNVALGNGGGVYIGLSITQVSNSTVSDNVAFGSGGGISTLVPDDFPFIPFDPAINNTIIAGNNGTKPDVEGDFTSNGFNLLGNTTGSTGFENDLIEPDITKILDTTLADNGGSTLTHALILGSPAIDAGNNNDVLVGITTDQRGMGFNRIVDGNNDTIAIVDIGAFEVQPSTSVPEPSSMLGLMGLVIIGTGSLLRRKLQNKS